MKNIKMGVLFCAVALSLGMSTGAFAATKNKKINRMSFKVVSDIQVDQKMGQEYISVTTGSGNYYFEEYEVLNSGFVWTDTDVPNIKFTFRAEDGYEFNITKASQLSIAGGDYVTASRADGGTTLNVTLKLPSLENQVGDIATVNFSSSGAASWSEVSGAGSYEVRLLRGTTTVGGTQTAYTTNMDLSHYMTKAGYYEVKVRPVSARNASVTGDWTTSSRVHVSAEEAKMRAQKEVHAQSAGTWTGYAPHWSFVTSEGVRVTDAWRLIDNTWYYFGSDGVALTGWQYIGDKWYYFDTMNANLYRNTVTPDGYEVDINGVWIAR